MGFGSVVHEGFFEPRMLQSLLGRDSLLGVVHEDPSEQVEELPVEVGVARDGFLQYVSWVKLMSYRQNIQEASSWP